MQETIRVVNEFLKKPIATDIWFVDEHTKYEQFVELCEIRQYAYPPFSYLGVRVHQIFLELLTDEDRDRLPWYCQRRGIWVRFSNDTVGTLVDGRLITTRGRTSLTGEIRPSGAA